MSASLCVSDVWLSGVLRRPVYRLDIASLPRNGDHDAGIAQLRESPVFVYAKIPCGNTAFSQRLSAKGFYCVEATLAFEKTVAPVSPTMQAERIIRFARSEDEAEVRRIARTSFVYSRFHLDHRFSKDEANTIKEAWAGNFFSGERGTHMIIAEERGACAGFLQLIAQGETLTIDLFAVAADLRGRGIASAMIAFAENAIPGISRVRVGTQAANIPSVRLYGRCGFCLVGCGYVFHYHH